MVSAERKRARRRWLAWAAALASAVIAWQVAERAIEVDQYRPQIEEALEGFTGLPVSIGTLDLAWHPVPCLSAYDITIGEGDLRATATRLDVFPALRALLAWRLEIASVELIEPALTLPATTKRLDSEWRRIRAQIETALAKRGDSATSSRGADLRIDRVLAEQASLRFGSADAHPILASVTASGIGAGAIEIEIDAEVPSTGAVATGTLRVPAAEAAELHGEITVSGVRPDRFAALPELLHAEWQAQIELTGQIGRELRAEFEGEFAPQSEGALGGTFSGTARVAPETATAVELKVDGEGLKGRISGQLFDGKHSVVRIDSLDLSGDALVTLLASLAADRRGVVDLLGTPDAKLEVRDLAFAIATASRPRLVSGRIQAHGFEARSNDAPLASDLRLDARVAAGALRIALLRGGPFDLRGLLTPDTEWRHLALDLTGSVTVSDALLRALGAPEAIRDAAGVLSLEELRAVFPAPEGESAPFSLRAQLAGGALRIASDAVEDTVSGLDIRVSGGGGETLGVEARATSAALGPVTVSAALEPAKGRARGTLVFDPAAAGGLLRDESARQRLAHLLRAYGGSGFDFQVERPAAASGDTRLRIERAQPPRVTAVALLRSEGGDLLREVEVEAQVPADALRALLPETAQTSGSGSLRLRRSGSDAAFTAEADLDALGVAVGELVEKKPGEPLRLRVEGRAGAKGWSPTRLVVASGKSSLPLPLTDGRIVAPELDVDLGAWSFLLVDGASASGRIRGAFDSANPSALLRLAEVGLHLSPELGVDALDGEVAIDGDDWSVRDLRIRGAQSDATLDAAVREGRLVGQLRGASLDFDFVRALVDQIEALLPDDEADASPKISGDLAVALDRVGYGRSEAQTFVAAIAVGEGDIHVRDLAFEAYGGHVAGRVDVDVLDEQRSLALDLDFADVTGQFLDDLLSEEPRGIRGVFSGKLRFAAPLHDDAKVTMAGGSGVLAATGRDGTFGRLGLATKLVTVLRSTETLRMKLPAMQDEGLVFDTVKAEVAIEQGRAAIQSFELDSTSYAINATGEIDFAADRSHVPIEVNAIKGLTEILGRIPVAGDVLEIVNVRLVATGSPYDMKVGVASITDQLLGAGMAGPKAVIKGVRDAVGLLRRTRPTEPIPPPSPEPTPEPAVPPAPEAAPIVEDEPPPAPEIPEPSR